MEQLDSYVVYLYPYFHWGLLFTGAFSSYIYHYNIAVYHLKALIYRKNEDL